MPDSPPLTVKPELDLNFINDDKKRDSENQIVQWQEYQKKLGAIKQTLQRYRAMGTDGTK